MKRLLLAALALAACRAEPGAEERYGFITTLGRDTVSMEGVVRRGDVVTLDAVDRFPRVRRRHATIQLGADGSVRRLEMRIHTPSEPLNQRERTVVAEVSAGSVHLTKEDAAGKLVRDYPTGGAMAMPHVPQLYTLYELFLAAALRRGRQLGRAPGDTVQLRQFYIDREFDDFPLHRGSVRRQPGGTVEITHGWLAGTGNAQVDSAYRLLSYSGAHTTYLVEVRRLPAPPDVAAVAQRFEAAEAASGGMHQLSVRDTVRARIGAAELMVDYGRPRARGRVLLGQVIPYDRVWRTGANAATGFTTSHAITLAGIAVPAGSYTLWTLPHANGVELVVNRETGQWGTGYRRAMDLARAPMATNSATPPVEQFTILITPRPDRSGELQLAWGPFRWTAPIQVAR